MRGASRPAWSSCAATSRSSPTPRGRGGACGPSWAGHSRRGPRRTGKRGEGSLGRAEATPRAPPRGRRFVPLATTRRGRARSQNSSIPLQPRPTPAPRLFFAPARLAAPSSGQPRFVSHAAFRLSDRRSVTANRKDLPNGARVRVSYAGAMRLAWSSSVPSTTKQSRAWSRSGSRPRFETATRGKYPGPMF